MATTSKQPRRQRLSRYNAALHERRHFMGVHIGKELRAKLGTKRRAIPVIKGDTVKVLRGDKKGHKGKVTRVDLSSSVVFIEGLSLPKARGTDMPMPIQPSNLVLVDGDFAKKGRKEVLDRAKLGSAQAPKPKAEAKGGMKANATA